PEPMTTLQYAACFNITGIFVTWLIAAALGRGLPLPFFRSWAAAFGIGAMIGTLELLATLGERAPGHVALELALTVLSAAMFVKSGLQLENRTLPRWFLPAAVLLGSGYGTAVVLSGLSFLVAFVPPVLCLTWGFFRLSLALL